MPGHQQHLHGWRWKKEEYVEKANGLYLRGTSPSMDHDPPHGRLGVRKFPTLPI